MRSNYGAKGNTEFNIPGDATLVYEVELLSFEKEKQPWELDTYGRSDIAEQAKNKGNKYVKVGYLRLAAVDVFCFDFLYSLTKTLPNRNLSFTRLLMRFGCIMFYRLLS
ncbi:Hypothetical predicted protein [Mytilus galloprovincialis]|uniref:peptidylprolyl isomerase n=1 Tax=Mytilus galloprovincialis TaxID=29158 RepID=A0A8B6G549_MYTGA|nr:Hypothetical predicted protein [Mytilus galloprovincialis]